MKRLTPPQRLGLALVLLAGCISYFALAQLGPAGQEARDDSKKSLEALEQRLKAMPAQEAHFYCLSELQKIADEPDNRPELTVFLMRGLPEYEDPPDVAVLRTVLRKTQNRAVRDECVRSLGEYIADPCEAREDVLRILVSLLADERAYLRAQAVNALGKSGDVRQVRHVKPLLDDNERGVRTQAAEAVCDLLGWKWKPAGSPEELNAWIQQVKPRLEPVMKALDQLAAACQGEAGK